jgi:hypothetical protein
MPTRTFTSTARALGRCATWQSTDSIAKQIDYGFARDVGTTPPMDHRIDETGISIPDCLEESREARPCKN